jgi:pimeloyl-ACP methyl ester carboxylesterase
MDSVRAALKGFPNIANQIVIIGQSQGGGAAFATAGIAPLYAPELHIRGTVATGVPFFGSGSPSRPPAQSDAVDPTVAYSLYIAIMTQQGNLAEKVDQLVTARALPLLEKARTTCVAALFQEVGRAGLSRRNALTPAYVAASKVVSPNLLYTTVRLPQPLFVGTGQLDHDVPPASQLALVRNACVQGSVVEAHLYAGLTHGATVNASLKDSVPFVRRVLAGETIKSVCEPVAE